MSNLTTSQRTDLADARALLDQWMAESVTGVMSRGLVIDRLLDLRSLVRTSQMLLHETAVALSNTPGVNVVEAQWWLETVEGLDELLQRIEVVNR